MSYFAFNLFINELLTRVINTTYISIESAADTYAYLKYNLFTILSEISSIKFNNDRLRKDKQIKQTTINVQRLQVQIGPPFSSNYSVRLQ